MRERERTMGERTREREKVEERGKITRESEKGRVREVGREK